MRKAIVILTVLFVGSFVSAAIVVPEGFVVDYLLEDCQGNVYPIVGPRLFLESIRNPAYGFGVIVCAVDSGILKVLRISKNSIDLLGTLSGYPISPVTGAAIPRFDWTGLFGNELYATVVIDNNGSSAYTDFVHISSTGIITRIASLGGSGNQLAFGASFDFTNGQNDYTPGAYLLDGDGANGTDLYHMDEAFNFTSLSENHIPDLRTDLDIVAWEFDQTGLYNYYLTGADADWNNDHKALIYQLLPDLSWEEMSDIVTVSSPYYRDLAFSYEGAFGQKLYVTNQLTEVIQSVDPNGVHSVFASGFSTIESITVSDDGEHMYVSDENGIYRIRSVTTIIGPTIIMQEPKVEADGVHTNPLGIDNVQLLFSERVEFDNSDVSITDANDITIPLSVSGSNSPFMVIVFGEKLLNNKYTITIHDSVVSAETSNSIDGDNDGLAGGDAVIVMEHRERLDSDNDNDIDMVDLSALAIKWLWED